MARPFRAPECRWPDLTSNVNKILKWYVLAAVRHCQLLTHNCQATHWSPYQGPRTPPPGTGS